MTFFLHLRLRACDYVLVLLALGIWLCSSRAAQGSGPRDIGAGQLEQIDEIATVPSEGLVVTVEHSGRALLWNGRRGERLGELGDAENGPPVLVRFVPNDRTVVLLDNSGHLRVWEIDSRRLVRRTMVTTAYVSGADLSGDGGWLLIKVSLPDRFELYDIRGATTLERSFPAHDSIAKGWLFQDGKKVLLERSESSEDVAELFDAQTGERVASYRLPFQSYELARAPARNLAAVGTFGGIVQVMDSGTWKPLRTLAQLDTTLRSIHEVGQTVAEVAFSPDGTRVAAARGQGAIVWDVDTGRELLSWSGFRFMAGVGFLDNTTLVAAGGGALRVGAVP